MRAIPGPPSTAPAPNVLRALPPQHQHYAYANGQQVAALGEDGTIDAATQLTAFDSSDLGTTPALVLEGDTLQSIAQRVYGNPSLWYVLAAANAVTDAGFPQGSCRIRKTRRKAGFS